MIRMAVSTIFATVIVFGASAAVAQTAQRDARKDFMNDMNEMDQRAKKLAAVASGVTPFNIWDARSLAVQFANSAAASRFSYVIASQTGADAVDPKIWQNLSDFNSKFDKLIADSHLLYQFKDFDSFKVLFSNIQKDCSSCHEAYPPEQK